MAHLGLQGLFHEVFHIASADFVPKPSPESFDRLCGAHAVAPAATCFFEDLERNLAPAKALGMTTVLVGAKADHEPAAYVDHVAANLAAFLSAARLQSPA